MDGDHVTPSQSNDADGYKESNTSNRSSFAATLTALCPQYMAMGMTYDQFWHSNTAAHKAFREAYMMRLHNEEWARWRQGAYTYTALLMAAPVMRASFGKGKVEPGKYPDEPWPLTEKEAKEREEAKRIRRMEQFMARLEAEQENNQRKGASSHGDG